MKSRVKLDDATWIRIFSFLKFQPDVRIANPKQCRRFLEAVLWITRTGAQWRELPRQFGKWNTIYKRYRLGVDEKFGLVYWKAVLMSRT